MQLIRLSVEDSYMAERPAAVAIGNFDGFHLGHRAVVKAMWDEAVKQGHAKAVLTFEPHPRRFFSATHAAFRLERLHDKLQHLRSAGVGRLYIARFNSALSGLSAEAFVHEILIKKLQARHVVTGTNFGFGKGRSGTAETLSELLAKYHATHERVAPVKAGYLTCSSTAVREALEDSDMEKASKILGRPYTLIARVQKGDQRGRVLGYPTANLHFPRELLLPKFGIYAVIVTVNGKFYKGVANLGVRPMYRSETPLLEVHLFDMNADLYGQKMRVELVQRIRGEEAFESEAELKEQMANDCKIARILLEQSA